MTRMRSGGSNLSGMSRRTRRNPGEGTGDGPSAAARIGLLTAKIGLLTALIGAAATVLIPLITSNGSSSAPVTTPPVTAAQPEPPGQMPPPRCPTCVLGGKTFSEQASEGTSKPTFRNPRAFSGRGQSVQPGQRVEVVCWFLDPNAPESVRPGYWYLIASSPWNRQYYTVANSYLNGDPPEGPPVTPVDNGVPEC